MTHDDTSLVPFEVFEGSAWETSLLKSILDDNDIESIITQASSLPWNIMPTESAAMKVFVAHKDLEKAKAIVEEFSTNMEKEDDQQE